MVTFPNCKINIGLHITGKRADGYHNLETVFYPLSIHDCLEIITLPQKETAPVFTTSGLTIQGNAGDNICFKAWQLLKIHYPHLPPVAIHLHKNIPMGAGLGGGSADGAFLLHMLNEKFSLNIHEQQLLVYALELGSDCPFFIINTTCFGSGRGETLQPLTLDLSKYYFVIINPDIHINTGWAFSQLALQSTTYKLREAIHEPVTTWKNNITNDFEKAITRRYPIIADLKTALYQQGALYASMTGSGSTLFALFESAPHLTTFPDNYFVKIIAPALAK